MFTVTADSHFPSWWIGRDESTKWFPRSLRPTACAWVKQEIRQIDENRRSHQNYHIALRLRTDYGTKQKEGENLIRPLLSGAKWCTCTILEFRHLIIYQTEHKKSTKPKHFVQLQHFSPRVTYLDQMTTILQSRSALITDQSHHFTFSPLWRNSPTRARAASFLWFLDHT